MAKIKTLEQFKTLVDSEMRVALAEWDEERIAEEVRMMLGNYMQSAILEALGLEMDTWTKLPKAKYHDTSEQGKGVRAIIQAKAQEEAKDVVGKTSFPQQEITKGILAQYKRMLNEAIDTELRERAEYLAYEFAENVVAQVTGQEPEQEAKE